MNPTAATHLESVRCILVFVAAFGFSGALTASWVLALVF